MSRLDYSKWDHIEISDDEDETHPNIDTPSLFRWRHQARLEREAEQEKEKTEIKKNKIESERKLKETQEKLQKQSLDDAEREALKKDLEKMQQQEKDWKKKEAELDEKIKSQPWNVDTICKQGFSKSVINKPKAPEPKPKTDQEKMEKQKEYQEKYNKDLKTYGMLSKIDESQKYLQNHPHLISENAANFLVIWCIDLEVEEKHTLMERVAHQTIILQFILELAKNLKCDPRACFAGFFSRYREADKVYMAGFNDELNAFKIRVKDRAQARITKALEEYEREEKAKRMGPGGLDPADVFETLPKILQDCFEKQDIPMLQKAISEMDPEEAKYHMKRCVDSGLWVPGKSEGKEEPPVDQSEQAETPSTPDKPIDEPTEAPPIKQTDEGTEV